MTDYIARKERPGDWRVWKISPLTGDRKDCVAMHTTATAARADARKRNAALTRMTVQP